MVIFYTPEAIDDLKRLRIFIEDKNPNAAQKAVADLLTGVHILKRLPSIGRKVTKAPDPRNPTWFIVSQYIVRV